MASIFEFKIRNRLAGALKKNNLDAPITVIDEVIATVLHIVEKTTSEDRVLRLRQYQMAGRKERDVLRSIIHANENISAPPSEILGHIKKYLKYFTHHEKN